MAGESQEKELGRAEGAVLLRIYLGDAAKSGHLPLYEAIVLKAREMHLTGATVLRSSMGFGAASKLHTAKILQLSTDLPIVIEIVDFQEKIQPFLKVLDGMMDGGLVTLCPVQVHYYKPRATK
jgi:PII-like signaling protein